MEEATSAFEGLLDPVTETEKAEDDDVVALDDAEEQDSADADKSKDAKADDKSEEPELYTVKVDGTEVKVPLAELVNGYQRTADYTRKTMALAEQRKVAESELLQIRDERAHYSALLGQLGNQIRAVEPQIDWATLANTDPAEWTRQKVMQQDRSNAMAQINAEHERVNQINAQEQERAALAVLDEESEKLTKAIPSWSDPAKATAEKTKLLAFAQERGYTAEEISSVMDSRAILLLRDAMRFRDATAKAALLKPVPGSPQPKASVPGSNPRPSSTSDVAKARQQLARTGSVYDAASAFEHFI